MTAKGILTDRYELLRSEKHVSNMQRIKHCNSLDILTYTYELLRIEEHASNTQQIKRCNNLDIIADMSSN